MFRVLVSSLHSPRSSPWLPLFSEQASHPVSSQAAAAVWLLLCLVPISRGSGSTAAIFFGRHAKHFVWMLNPCFPKKKQQACWLAAIAVRNPSCDTFRLRLCSGCSKRHARLTPDAGSGSSHKSQCREACPPVSGPECSAWNVSQASCGTGCSSDCESKKQRTPCSRG